MHILKVAAKRGLIRALGSVGVLLPLMDERKRAGLLPEELSEVDKALFYKGQENKNNINEVKNMNENALLIISIAIVRR